jgi:hypothetical protein
MLHFLSKQNTQKESNMDPHVFIFLLCTMIFTLFETLECLQIDFLGTFFKAISAVFEILTISVLKTG